MHLAVALDGAGWHPAAWREPRARPDELLSPGYWAGLAGEAERGLLDFVTLEDDLGRGRPRTDRVRGRLDAGLIAARIAPLTSYIGLMPTVVVTHTEPFHIAKAIATLDYVSGGRAGVRVKISADRREAAHFGRRPLPPVRPADRDDPAMAGLIADLFAEAADYVEVVRRLWDSWEDDAEIRDVTTGRFVDRGKLHYINFTGGHFSVKGPSITPRPPQGQPVVGALAHASVPYHLVASSADVGFVTPHDTGQAHAIIAEIRAAQQAAGRAGPAVHVFGDVVVFLDGPSGRGTDRKARLDELAGREVRSDALIFTGTAPALADRLEEWRSAGLSGFRLRPGALPDDLTAIVTDLVPELQRRGLFRLRYEARTLRGLLGLPHPASRYAAARAARPASPQPVSGPLDSGVRA